MMLGRCFYLYWTCNNDSDRDLDCCMCFRCCCNAKAGKMVALWIGEISGGWCLCSAGFVSGPVGRFIVGVRLVLCQGLWQDLWSIGGLVFCQGL